MAEETIEYLRADRDNSNRLLDECRHERNVLQKICAERADDIQWLRELILQWETLAVRATPTVASAPWRHDLKEMQAATRDRLAKLRV